MGQRWRFDHIWLYNNAYTHNYSEAIILGIRVGYTVKTSCLDSEGEKVLET